MFEFIKKVLLPKSEKRIVSSVVDLFFDESLSNFELISLPALMIEHMYQVVYIKEEKHGMTCGYFLNRVFNHFKVICEKETPGTIKQMFTLNTLIENGCLEGKVGTKSKVLELIYVQVKFSMEVDGPRLALATKDVEILYLNLKIQLLSSKGPCVLKELKT